MKMKKLISIMSSIAISISAFVPFATVSYAKTDNMNANITVDVVTDVDDYYYVDYYLNMDATIGFNQVSNPADTRGKYYSGNGVYHVFMTLNGLTSDDVYELQDETFGYTGNFTANGYAMGSATRATVKALMDGTTNPVKLVRISTNYMLTDKTEEEIETLFSDFGYTSIKIASIEMQKDSFSPSSDLVTTYAVGDDGFTQHIDADYALVTPETPAQEPTKYAVTVTGGTADVTEAEEGQTVTVTADIPSGKVIDSIDASVDYKDNENGTYTFTMPAETVTFTINYVDEVVEFEATAAKSATKYYTGVAEDVKEIQVFDVTVANSSLAKWIFTFASASASDSRTFTPDMSSFGDSTVEFDAWIVGAPADVTLTVE